jgi:SAM-dependent methyltransferase
MPAHGPTLCQAESVQREDWDRRYQVPELVWSEEPNRFLVDEAGELTPGRALDLGCGEGRNAVWLARRGWRVVGVDFSPVALDKGRRLADRTGVEVTWVEADVTSWAPTGPFDLVALCYLQLPDEVMAATLGRVVPAVEQGGTLLVVGHDRRNLDEGVGGPRDRRVLLDPGVVAGALGGLTVERAGTVERPIAGAPRPALDTLVRAHRPA